MRAKKPEEDTQDDEEVQNLVDELDETTTN